MKILIRSSLLVASLSILRMTAGCGIPAGAAAPGPAGKTSVDQIVELARTSRCSDLSWKNRGQIPTGYISGMALTFGRSLCRLKGLGARPAPALIMASERLGTSRADALKWYQPELSSRKLDVTSTKAETLKSLYTLLTGLGVRESGGQHSVGYDRTAKKLNATTAEAGLFQTSFNSLNFSPELRTLYLEYRARPGRCLLEVFREEVPELRQPILGIGEGAAFQRFNKSCPAFAAESAAIMLRLGRMHYGPINRKEVEIQPACADLFSSVDDLIALDPESACQALR